MDSKNLYADPENDSSEDEEDCTRNIIPDEVPRKDGPGGEGEA